MSRKTWQRIFSVLLMAGMLLSFIQPMRVSMQLIYQKARNAKSAAQAENALDSRRAGAGGQTAGKTDFFVWMTEKADLSPAADLKTKAEKGQFIFETLRATAERTQKDLLGYLQSQGISYKSFYIANKILVKGGSLTLVESLAGRTDVAQITANHQYQLEEPFKEAVPEAPSAIEPNLTFVNADDVWAIGVGEERSCWREYKVGLGCPAIINKSGWDGVGRSGYNWSDATGTCQDA
jgi:hypothetical protein